MIRQKFAFCLGKNRVFKDQQRRDVLIVCYSNDFKSLQLLRLVREATTDQNVHKRLRLKAQILYLSNAVSLFNLTQDAENCRLLSENFPNDWIWHFAHESAILNEDFRNKDQEVIRNSLLRYDELFALCLSNSVRNEFKRLLRTKLIYCLSEMEFQCSTVLLPDTADELANDVLNALCFGRVASLSHMASMLDDRFEPVQIVRPFRDISSRELEAMHNIEQDESSKPVLASCSTESGVDESNCKNKCDGSLQALTADFISELRTGGFPATVSTILSVSIKIDNKTVGRNCGLCYDQFETDEYSDDNWKTTHTWNEKICQICSQLIASSGPKFKQSIQCIISTLL
ncbi:hypothetical protein niasHT_007318 [Heterodera trifolii]|uniref:Uncharacterized protein n=1 Tax=Heterodera trifolii TaxID=157864 RepID=A0ABD2LLB0_9BILA